MKHEVDSADLAALRAGAERAIAGGDLLTARALLERAVVQSDPDPGLWMSLAACRRGLGDLLAAVQAVERALALEPRYFPGLLMRASLLERLGSEVQAGAAYGVALTQVPPEESLNAATRQATEHARKMHARHVAMVESALLRELGMAQNGRINSETRRATAFIERLLGKRRAYHQEPVLFNYPGLPEVEFYDRELFPWLPEFEARADSIRDELVPVLGTHSDALTPYVDYPPGIPLDQWAELNQSPRWSAYHVYEAGQPVEEHIAKCPRTVEAIRLLPQPSLPGRSPAAMFSVLQPRTRIPPHTGIANFRLVVHLPLIIPPSCGFRVGAETREWQPGEAWVFDDTIEHEAWNDSDQYRTILICDIWHPQLSESERTLIAAIIDALDRSAGGARGEARR